MTATGAKKLRQDFKQRTCIKNLVNFNELKIFESALGQHNIVTILKKEFDEDSIAKTCITQRLGIANHELLLKIINGNDEKTNYYEVAQKDLYDGQEYYIRINGLLEENKNPLNQLLNKVKKQGQLLGVICNVNNGLRSGLDKIKGKGVFILNKKELLNIYKSSQINNSIIKKYYKNSDVNRYNTNNDSKIFVIYSGRKTNLENYHQINNHLLKYKNIIEKKRWKEKLPWYSLVRTRDEKIFLNPKIICPQRSLINKFGYNELDWYAGSDVFFITQKSEYQDIKLKYILALINSKLYYLWLFHRGKRKGNYLELIAKPLSEIPIKKISEEEQKPFVEMVNQILEITSKENYNPKNPPVEQKLLEQKIDQMVYKLYGLSPEEIKIVEGKNEKVN